MSRNRSRKEKRDKKAEEINILEAEKKTIYKKIWRQLYANASSNKRLEKEPWVRKTVKKRPRRINKRLGFAQINYDLIELRK